MIFSFRVAREGNNNNNSKIHFSREHEPGAIEIKTFSVLFNGWRV